MMMADNDAIEEEVVGVQAVVPAVPPKKRRKRHHIEDLLPPRPKRALNAYSMFLKDFFRQQGGLVTRDTILEASRQWQAIDADRKQEYEAMCVEDKARYATEMGVWKQQKIFVKRPASAYALFLKDTWTAEKAAGTVGDRGFVDIGKLASERWKAITADEKEAYMALYVDLVEQKRFRMAHLAAGNVTFTANGMEVQVPVPAPVPADNSDNDGEDFGDVDMD